MSVGRSRSGLALLAGVAAMCALTACSGSAKPGKVVTVTVPPTTPASTPATPPSTATSTAAPTTSAPPVRLTKLPGRCDGLLPLVAVENAINRNLKGKTAFVLGLPEKDIKRLSYINCRYGITSKNGTPAVEIGVSLYASPQAAAARIKSTVDDYVNNHGAQVSSATVNGQSAKILTGGSGAGYTAATLVLAHGQRTVAVSVSNPVPASAQTKALEALAALADNRTAH